MKYKVVVEGQVLKNL